MTKKTSIEFGEVDLNKFEYFNNLLNTPKILKTHNESIDEVILSNDDKYIISLSSNSKSVYSLIDKISYIKIWDFKTGKCLRTIKSDQGINSIAISNDNKYIISGCWDNIKIWNFETGKSSKVIKTNNCNDFITITKDNKYIIVGDGDTIEIWDFKTGECLYTIEEDDHKIESVVLSNDNKYLVLGLSYKTIKIYDFVMGNYLQTFESYHDKIYLVILSGNKYIILSSYQKNVEIWAKYEFENKIKGLK